MRLFSGLLPLIISLWSATVAQQDSGRWWKLGGPIGGLGYNIALRADSPSVLFVTDAWAGIHKSLDGGANWAASNTGITARAGASDDAIPVFSLAIDPNDNNIVWAGTQNGEGLFRSTDGGNTWHKRDAGIDLFPLQSDPELGITIRNISVRMGHSSEIYVSGEAPTGTRGVEFERTRGFVYKSTDAGASWHNTSPPGGFPNLTRWLFIDPDTPQNLLVSTGIFDREAADDDSAGAWRSTNGGVNWVPANAGTTAGRSRHFGGAARNPENPRMLLLAAGNNVDSEIRNKHGAVYKSIDGGINWIDITPPRPQAVAYEIFTAVAFAPSNPQIVYAATSETVYRSTDQGLTWSAHRGLGDAPWGPPGVRSGVPIDMVVSPTDPNTLYINNYGGGLFKSIDGGANWISWSNGYTGADVRSIAIKPATGGVAIAVNGRSGPFRYDAAGLWHGANHGPVPWYPEGSGIAYDPHDAEGRRLLASDALSGVVFRSADGGTSWTIQLNLEDSSTIWSTEHRHGVRTFVFAPSTPGTVYAGFMAHGLETPHALDYPESFGVWRSTDGGYSWAPRNTGLPAGLRGRNIVDLAVSHNNPDLVYSALRDGGLYRTTDGGQSWVIALGNITGGDLWNDVWSNDDPVPRHSLLAVDVNPLNDSDIVIGSNMFGVYRSRDAGANWSHLLPASALIPQGTRDHVQITSVLFDPTDTTRLYVADWHGGVYASHDGGVGWSQINNGLETRAVNRLAVSEDGQYLFAATQGNGVFRYKAKDSVATTVRHPGDRRRVANKNPGIVIPTPVTSTTYATFVLGNAGRVRIDILDAGGNTVTHSFSGWRAAGPHRFYIDANILAAGSYYVRLLESGRTHVTRFDVAR